MDRKIDTDTHTHTHVFYLAQKFEPQVAARKWVASSVLCLCTTPQVLSSVGLWGLGVWGLGLRTSMVVGLWGLRLPGVHGLGFRRLRV